MEPASQATAAMTADIHQQPSAAETPEVSIIIATFNERENIRATIAAILQHVSQPVEVIIVDDGSPDLTADHVEELDDPRVRVIHRRRTVGFASAIVRGIMASRGRLVGWIDADMSIETKYLPGMIEKTKDYDVVIASRFVPGGGDERHPFRVFASRLVNGFANLLLGYGIKDYDSCVTVVRRSVFDSVMPIPYGFGDFFIEFVYGCCRKGLKVCEVPYVLCARQGGTSKSFPSLGGFLWLGVKYCVRIIATRLRPD